MADPEYQEFTIGYSDPDEQYSGASIVVRRWQYLPTVENPRFEGARMRVEVVSSTNVPKELFVWERHTVYIEGVPEFKDRVVCVAKVSDLSVYPIDSPDENSDIPPFYRSEIFDMPFSSPTDMVSTWDVMLESFNALLKSYVDLGLTD